MGTTIRIWGDFETRGYCDLTKVGANVYSEHPSTGVVCLSYAIDHQPTQWWVPPEAALDWSDEKNWTPWDGLHGTNGRMEAQPTLLGEKPHAYGWSSRRCTASTQGMPTDLYWALLHGAHVEVHNYSFEYSIWANVMVAKYGWLPIKDEQWRDTMAVACYYALPAKLDQLARALKFQGKDTKGGGLISKYSKLNLKTAKPLIPWEDLEAFVRYCIQDVQVEQAISDYLGDLPDREQEVFLLDLKMNTRGLFLDKEGIEAATAIVDQRSEELQSEFRELTGLNPTQRDKCMAWFAGQGLVLDNMTADYLEELLDEGELPQGNARRALEIRLAINKASTKKLDAMARNRGANGRAKFQSRYHGTMSGRPTGSGFQPLNLNRGMEDVAPEQLVRDIMHRSPEWLDSLYSEWDPKQRRIVRGGAMDAVGKASRHWIKAGPGNKIIAGDLVSIEAVLLSCLSGEEWKVEAFRLGKKIYELMGDKIHNLPEGTVTKKTHPAERQDGKTGELAFGYQGALGAWLKFDSSGRHTDERILEICKAWRAEHPMIVQLWRELEKAAIAAVKTGELQTYRQIGYEMVDEWLSCILPDGKRIWYREPELRVGMPAWHRPEIKRDCARGTCRCEPVDKLTYMAQKEGQWKRVYTYGGKLTENVTQATSRQVLVPILKRVEAAGYPIILTVYDEVVSEVPLDFGSEEEFKKLMTQSPGDWAKNWPIKVDVWVGDRYKK